MSMISSEVRAIIETFSNDLKTKAYQWLEWDKNSQTLEEVINLIKSKNIEKLSNVLLKRQLFGTAGIRSHMKAGFDGMNDLIIIQTTQGLVKYLLQVNHKKAIENGIIIGYDGRHNSHRFAQLAASVCLYAGCKVYLFSQVVSTPLVAFAVKSLSAAAGIVVTASHNPKEFNGYKVFFDNGAQINYPHDVNIQNAIIQNLAPWSDSIWDVSSLTYNSKLIDPLSMIMEKYFNTLALSTTQSHLVSKTDLKVVYTSLHGVGHPYVTQMFKTLKFKNYFPVESQKDPDPNFPTVLFPNPEEGDGVLNEAIKTATEHKATLIIANDPDTDRCAFAELYNGQWRIFNGNEIGALLGWWAWFQCFNSDNSNIQPEDCYMISSAVSSKILEAIAKKEGFNWCETLTGFKWIANKGDELVKKGKHVLFTFEEALGYMMGTNVLDKDGISAAAAGLEASVYLREKNLSLVDQLNMIYDRYGYHYSINSYYICHDSDKIKAIFNRVADLNGPNKYFDKVDNFKVVRIRDLNRGYDSSTVDHKPVLPVDSSAFMLTAYFDNGSVITFRTSGTEPKIKYYSEIIGDPNEKDRNKIEDSHRKLVKAAVEFVLQPTKNNLAPKEG